MSKFERERARYQQAIDYWRRSRVAWGEEFQSNPGRFSLAESRARTEAFRREHEEIQERFAAVEPFTVNDFAGKPDARDRFAYCMKPILCRVGVGSDPVEARL